MPWLASGPGWGSKGGYQLPGRPRMMLFMQLGSSGAYSDVHFRTSKQGSAARCSSGDLTANRSTGCTLELGELKAGEKVDYDVTMTGTRDGAAFQRSGSTTVEAVAVSATAKIDGTVARDGAPVTAKKGSTLNVEYTVTNASAHPLSNLSFFTGDGSPMATKCAIASVPAGGTGSCTFTATEADLSPMDGRATLPPVIADGEAGYKAYLALDPVTIRFR